MSTLLRKNQSQRPLLVAQAVLLAQLLQRLPLLPLLLQLLVLALLRKFQMFQSLLWMSPGL